MDPKIQFLNASSDQFSRQCIIKKSAFFTPTGLATLPEFDIHIHSSLSSIKFFIMLYDIGIKEKKTYLMDKSVRKKRRHFDSRIYTKLVKAHKTSCHMQM